MSKGGQIAAGSVFGTLTSPRGRPQRALVPPTIAGTVEWIAAAGAVADDVTVLRVRSEAGDEHALSLRHFWPVRTPRPVRGRLASDEPLVTGQRILDSLFPVALGGKGAIPGG